MGIVEVLIQRGRHWYKWKDKITETLQDYALCEKFGWTLDYVKSMDEVDKLNFMSLLRGEYVGGK